MKWLSLALGGRPPAARGSCCRTTQSLPRFGLSSQPITVTAIDPADDIEAVTDILARRVSGLGGPPWLSLFEGTPPRGGMASDSDSTASTSPCPPPPRWGRPRTLSLDAKLSTLKGRSGRPPRGPSPPPHGRRPSPCGSSSSSGGSTTPEPERAPRPHLSRPRFDPRLWLQSQV